MVGKRGPKPVSLDMLLFWEQRWWRAFRELRDGPLFAVEPFIRAKRKRQLKALEKMTAQEFIRQEILDDSRSLLRGLPRQKPWLSNVDAAEAERERRIGFVRGRLRQRQKLAKRRAIWRALISASTPQALRRVCRRWARLSDVREANYRGRFHRRWARRYGSPKDSDPMDIDTRWCSPDEVLAHATEFLAIKKDDRFPKKKDDSRLDYLARGMAGVFARVSPLTGIRVLRNMKHVAGGPMWDDKSQCCACWHCARND